MLSEGGEISRDEDVPNVQLHASVQNLLMRNAGQQSIPANVIQPTQLGLRHAIIYRNPETGE